MRKKFLAIIATAAMVVTMIPAMAFADATSLPAADSNGVITLTEDVTLSSTYTVSAGEKVTIDLNGYELSMTDSSSATSALIKNLGELTITDSKGSGKISFLTTTPDTNSSPGYASNTISNYGIITIDGGTIENTSTAGGACYALDNYAGSTATINAGKLTARSTVVRVFNYTNNSKTSLNINGGFIESKTGYAVNANMGGTSTLDLNITGGTIKTEDTNYNLAVYLYLASTGSADSWKIDVTDGVFDGNFALNGKASNTITKENVSISGGEMTGVICYGDPTFGFVSGGEFTSNISEYLADGYVPMIYNAGTFEIISEDSANKEAPYTYTDPDTKITYYAKSEESLRETLDLDDSAEVKQVAYYVNFYNMDPTGNVDEDAENYQLIIKNGQKLQDVIKAKAEEEGCTLEAAKYDGYNFVGWYTLDENGKFNEVVDFEKSDFTADTDYYSAYEKVVTPTDDNSVETDETSEVDTGDDMNMAIPLAIAGLAIAVMAAVVFARRRFN